MNIKEVVYNKLIRDKIPEIMEAKGLEFTTHIAINEEYEEMLYKKIYEEVLEFKENKSIEEMADLFEVVYAICDLYKIDLDKLENVRIKKRDERGAFKERIILKKVYE
ncbi:MAG TPA: phosphoribosyl-ATP pyrophosphohydrolase [Clostridiales bacterium]|nr:phosphoribosyl-ATP pyrophosphohydrolase [Clostridiales bacterium]